MRIASVKGRAALVLGDEVADIETASGGAFGADPMSPYADWTAFREFADSVTAGTGPLVEADLDCPVPRPAQVFAIGLNYRSHAEESGMEVPTVPATFTKFPASPEPARSTTSRSSNGTVDWEVELVAVIGRQADRVAEADAWEHVAGLTVGQDISDRDAAVRRRAVSSRSASPGRATARSGPWLVTPDEFDDPDDLALGCSVDGETVQDARTSDLIFGVPRLVAELSAVLPAAARRHHLHRHARRRRRDTPTAPVPPGG